jgi:hypothetical protein
MEMSMSQLPPGPGRQEWTIILTAFGVVAAVFGLMLLGEERTQTVVHGSVVDEKFNLFQMVMRPELDTPRSTEAPNKYLFIAQFPSEDACEEVKEHLMMSIDVSGHVFTFICLSNLFHPAPESDGR